MRGASFLSVRRRSWGSIPATGGREGFTLVEVLVTVLVLGLAAVLVTSAILPATRNAVRRGERLGAQREARSTMEGLLALDFGDLAPGTLGPAPVSGYPDAERTVAIASAGPRLWTLEVTVRVGDEEATLRCLKGKREP